MATSSSQGSRLGRFGGLWVAAMALAAAGGWTGCVGNIGDGAPGEGTELGSDADVLGSPDTRRLSPIEMEQTVDDVIEELGISAAADDLLLAPPDVRYTFSNTAENGNFTTGQVQNIMAWAESVSDLISQDLDAAMGCTPTSAWEGCVSDFAHRLGRLAFRRPLDDDDAETFRTVFVNVMQDAPAPADGVRAVIELAFQSPQFWYLSNETRPDSRQLSSHAVAGRLSYFLWGTMPDATLRDAADADELQTAEQIRAQAERLLDDARAEVAITRFHREWLHVRRATSLSKDADLYPSFSPELASDMDREFDQFVLRTVSNGTIEDMLSSQEGFVNDRLESLYGLEPTSSGPDDWVWRSLGDERAGILTRPLFLANMSGQGESSLIHRGVAVIEDYFCRTLEPPADVADEAVEVPPNASSGKVAGVENRASKNQCSACHSTIDPIGLSFEVFDAIGAYRSAWPDGVEINTAGELQAGLVVDEPVTYDDSAELLSVLAALPTVQACYTSKWLEWSTGRRPSAEQAQEIERVTTNGQESIRSLLLGVATSPLLIQREDL